MESIEGSSVQAIPRAYVTLHHRPPADRPYGANTETDANGRYRFTGVPTGTFQICAVVLGSDYLSPSVAMNRPAPNLMAVGPGATVTAPPIRLVRGIRIRIRVEDGGGVIAAGLREPSSERPFLSLRVEPPDYPPTPLTVAVSAPSEYIYEALIPDTPAAKVQIFSRKLDIAIGNQPPSVQHTTREIAPRPSSAPLMTLRINVGGVPSNQRAVDLRMGHVCGVRIRARRGFRGLPPTADGKQYEAISPDAPLFTFALPFR